jgi:Acetyl-CoA dehydrogenase C-terminal like
VFYTAHLACDDVDLQGAALQLTHAWTWISGAVKALMELEANMACDNATSFLAGLGHVTIAWLWLDQAIAAKRLISQGTDSPDFLNGKIKACLFFFEHELPRAELWLRIVASQSISVRSFPAEEF